MSGEVRTCACGCKETFFAGFKNQYQFFTPNHVLLEIFPNYVRVWADVNDKKWIHGLLTFDVPGARYTQIYRSKQWDGTKKFYDWQKAQFPIGLFPLVLKDAKAAGKRLVVKDNRVFPKINATVPKLKGLDLRPYQIQAIEKCFEHRTGLIEAATNAGKTAIFSAVLKQMHPNPCLIMTHREELFEQLKDEVEKLTGLKVGVIYAKGVEIHPITIAMVPTLLNRIGREDQEVTEFYHSVQCIIADECHHLKAKGWSDIMANCKAPYRFGFSGTIFAANSYDGVLVRQWVGEVLFKISNDELISTGVSAVPKMKLHQIDSKDLLSNVIQETRAQFTQPVTKTEFQKAVYRKVVDLAVVKNMERNRVAVKIVKDNLDKSILLIVDIIEHGYIIEKMLNAAGVPCVYISGQADKSDIRSESLQDFKDGKLKVLISTTILDEGVDISRIEVMVFLPGKKSERQILQRVGRGLRRKHGVNEVEIHDFLDYGHKYIEAHSRARTRVYQREGFEIEVVA